MNLEIFKIVLLLEKRFLLICLKEINKNFHILNMALLKEACLENNHEYKINFPGQYLQFIGNENYFEDIIKSFN